MLHVHYNLRGRLFINVLSSYSVLIVVIFIIFSISIPFSYSLKSGADAASDVVTTQADEVPPTQEPTGEQQVNHSSDTPTDSGLQPTINDQDTVPHDAVQNHHPDTPTQDVPTNQEQVGNQPNQETPPTQEDSTNQQPASDQAAAQATNDQFGNGVVDDVDKALEGMFDGKRQT